MKNFDTTIPFEESSTSYGFGRIRVPIIFVRTRPLRVHFVIGIPLKKWKCCCIIRTQRAGIVMNKHNAINTHIA